MCVYFGGCSILFLSSLLFSPSFPVTVRFCLVFRSHFSASLFFFLLWLIPFFFLNLIFWFSFLPILLGKPVACVFFFPFFPFLFFSPFLFLSPNFSFSQHWNTGGSHAEELERPGAHPRPKARPQPPLFHSSISSEPQFTDCVALSEHSIPGDQIALQIDIMKN